MSSAPLGERLVEGAIRAAGWAVIALLLAIAAFVAREAWPPPAAMDVAELFGSTRWIPSPARGNAPHYGALGMIVGTLATTTIALSIAVPLGIGAAIYVAELAPKRVREPLKVTIELLAAIPSIVWGFVGLGVVGPLVAAVTGAPLGTNLLTGGLILGFMSAPVIVSLAEDALRAVPDAEREAGLALGASPWQLVTRVLIPSARSGLLAAVLLGLGRAMGETMAVLLANGHANQIPGSLVDPVRTLTAAIAAELGEAPKGSDHYRALFLLGLMLLATTAGLNAIAHAIVHRRRSAARDDDDGVATPAEEAA
jgi:phosphate transport system permease protein